MITEESAGKVSFSISDPTELKNFDSISADKIGKVGQVIHHTAEGLLICTGMARPDGVEALKSEMWAAIVAAAAQSHKEYIDRSEALQNIILRSPSNATA